MGGQVPKHFYFSNKMKSFKADMSNVSIARGGKEHLEVQVSEPCSILRWAIS